MGRAEEYLNQIPMWTKKKHSVEEVRAFLNALGAPDRDVPAVHVAGTNGKGSVCAFLTSVFRQAGYRIGTFTSPHLVDMRERFLINGAMADEAVFERAFETVRGTVREMEEKGFGHPTFFEFLFYMAVIIFREEKVDVMVIETGLGGRLDATNALEHPAASVITSISMDHTQYLGDTIEKIAWEKAGIIKAGVPVIFDASNPGVRTVIEGAAFRRGAARYPVNSPDFQVEGIRGGHLEVTVRLLRGDSLRLEIPFEALYQAQNAALAVQNRVASISLAGTRYTANSNTIFIVADPDTDSYDDYDFTIYTGIKNVPDIDGNANSQVVVATESGNSKVAKVVYIEDADVSGTGSVIFARADKNAKYVKDSNIGNYYEINAWQDGKSVTLKVKENSSAADALVKSPDTTYAVAASDSSSNAKYLVALKSVAENSDG